MLIGLIDYSFVGTAVVGLLVVSFEHWMKLIFLERAKLLVDFYKFIKYSRYLVRVLDLIRFSVLLGGDSHVGDF